MCDFIRRRFIALLTTISFCAVNLSPLTAEAQVMASHLTPGMPLLISQSFQPATLRGLKIDPEDPFHFQFVVDPGDEPVQGEAFAKNIERLIKYFLTSLTIPEQDLWVNLSPYEQQRMISPQFAKTQMGQDLLEQDYLLKQLSVSFMIPENQIGQAFWKHIYQQAYDQYQITDVHPDNFHKIWILPEIASVFQSERSAFIVDSQLDVMLEHDYFAQRNDTGSRSQQQQVDKLSEQAMREIILPQVKQEINQGQTFAQVRQIYHSLILAGWFKQALKSHILNQSYANQNKLKGIEVENAQQQADQIYDQYMTALRKGVCDKIKEDYDPVTQMIRKRKYFAGGMAWRVQNVIKPPEDKQSVQKVVEDLEDGVIVDTTAQSVSKNSGTNDDIKIATEVEWILDENLPDKVSDILTSGPEALRNLVGYYYEATFVKNGYLTMPGLKNSPKRIFLSKYEKEDARIKILLEGEDVLFVVELKHNGKEIGRYKWDGENYVNWNIFNRIRLILQQDEKPLQAKTEDLKTHLLNRHFEAKIYSEGKLNMPGLSNSPKLIRLMKHNNEDVRVKILLDGEDVVFVVELKRNDEEIGRYKWDGETYVDWSVYKRVRLILEQDEKSLQAKNEELKTHLLNRHFDGQIPSNGRLNMPGLRNSQKVIFLKKHKNEDVRVRVLLDGEGVVFVVQLKRSGSEIGRYIWNGEKYEKWDDESRFFSGIKNNESVQDVHLIWLRPMDSNGDSIYKINQKFFSFPIGSDYVRKDQNNQYDETANQIVLLSIHHDGQLYLIPRRLADMDESLPPFVWDQKSQTFQKLDINQLEQFENLEARINEFKQSHAYFHFKWGDLYLSEEDFKDAPDNLPNIINRLKKDGAPIPAFEKDMDIINHVIGLRDLDQYIEPPDQIAPEDRFRFDPEADLDDFHIRQRNILMMVNRYAEEMTKQLLFNNEKSELINEDSANTSADKNDKPVTTTDPRSLAEQYEAFSKEIADYYDPNVDSASGGLGDILSQASDQIVQYFFLRLAQDLSVSVPFLIENQNVISNLKRRDHLLYKYHMNGVDYKKFTKTFFRILGVFRKPEQKAKLIESINGLSSAIESGDINPHLRADGSLDNLAESEDESALESRSLDEQRLNLIKNISGYFDPTIDSKRDELRNTLQLASDQLLQYLFLRLADDLSVSVYFLAENQNIFNAKPRSQYLMDTFHPNSQQYRQFIDSLFKRLDIYRKPEARRKFVEQVEQLSKDISDGKVKPHLPPDISLDDLNQTISEEFEKASDEEITSDETDGDLEQVETKQEKKDVDRQTILTIEKFRQKLEQYFDGDLTSNDIEGVSVQFDYDGRADAIEIGIVNGVMISLPVPDGIKRELLIKHGAILKLHLSSDGQPMVQLLIDTMRLDWSEKFYVDKGIKLPEKSFLLRNNPVLLKYLIWRNRIPIMAINYDVMEKTFVPGTNSSIKEHFHSEISGEVSGGKAERNMVDRFVKQYGLTEQISPQDQLRYLESLTSYSNLKWNHLSPNTGALILYELAEINDVDHISDLSLKQYKEGLKNKVSLERLRHFHKGNQTMLNKAQNYLDKPYLMNVQKAIDEPIVAVSPISNEEDNDDSSDSSVSTLDELRLTIEQYLNGQTGSDDLDEISAPANFDRDSNAIIVGEVNGRFLSIPIEEGIKRDLLIKHGALLRLYVNEDNQLEIQILVNTLKLGSGEKFYVEKGLILADKVKQLPKSEDYREWDVDSIRTLLEYVLWKHQLPVMALSQDNSPRHAGMIRPINVDWIKQDIEKMLVPGLSLTMYDFLFKYTIRQGHRIDLRKTYKPNEQMYIDNLRNLIVKGSYGFDYYQALWKYIPINVAALLLYELSIRSGKYKISDLNASDFGMGILKDDWPNDSFSLLEFYKYIKANAKKTRRVKKIFNLTQASLDQRSVENLYESIDQPFIDSVVLSKAYMENLQLIEVTEMLERGNDTNPDESLLIQSAIDNKQRLIDMENFIDQIERYFEGDLTSNDLKGVSVRLPYDGQSDAIDIALVNGSLISLPVPDGIKRELLTKHGALLKVHVKSDGRLEVQILVDTLDLDWREKFYVDKGLVLDEKVKKLPKAPDYTHWDNESLKSLFEYLLWKHHLPTMVLSNNSINPGKKYQKMSREWTRQFWNTLVPETQIDIHDFIINKVTAYINMDMKLKYDPDEQIDPQDFIDFIIKKLALLGV